MTNSKRFSILTVLVLLVTSCTPATRAAEATLAPTLIPSITVEASSTPLNGLPQTEADVPRVSVADAAAAIKSGEAVVLDVRSAQAYQASHIPGAQSVPLFDIETNPTGLNLDKDKWIITYCT